LFVGESLKNIVIFGMGGFAEIVYSYFKQDPSFNVVAFTANESVVKEPNLFGLPVVPFEKIETVYPPTKFQMFIAIGYSNMNKKRARVFDEAKNKGYELASYVHSSTIVNDGFKMGENCFIFENNVLQPHVTLGNDVIIWTGNVISHHTVIKDHCFIVSHVAIAGNVVVEPFCFLGINSTVRNRVTIARECVIGAGAVILENTREKEVYVSRSTTKLDITSEMLKNL